MVMGVWSRWGISEFIAEFSVCLEDGGDGEGIWDWLACLTVSPILLSQPETFVSARLSRHGQWEVFQGG
jgi:hypothetical protein